jgi:hypothetical protein
MRRTRSGFLALIAVAVVGVFGVRAWAGTKTTLNVSVDTAEEEASGSMGTARNSTGNVQQIGCFAGSGTSSFESAGCRATNAAGVTATCFTTNPTAVHIIAALSGDAKIFFAWDQATGTCTAITIDQSSVFAPKI